MKNTIRFRIFQRSSTRDWNHLRNKSCSISRPQWSSTKCWELRKRVGNRIFVDHHRMTSSNRPLFTCRTSGMYKMVLYKMYKEYGVDIPKILLVNGLSYYRTHYYSNHQHAPARYRSSNRLGNPNRNRCECMVYRDAKLVQTRKPNQKMVQSDWVEIIPNGRSKLTCTRVNVVDLKEYWHVAIH